MSMPRTPKVENLSGEQLTDDPDGAFDDVAALLTFDLLIADTALAGLIGGRKLGKCIGALERLRAHPKSLHG
jgi:hypothetical protein